MAGAKTPRPFFYAPTPSRIHLEPRAARSSIIHTRTPHPHPAHLGVRRLAAALHGARLASRAFASDVESVFAAVGARHAVPAVTTSRSQILGRGAACESPCRAIHPEIRRRRIEGLRPSSPRRQHFRRHGCRCCTDSGHPAPCGMRAIEVASAVVFEAVVIPLPRTRERNLLNPKRVENYKRSIEPNRPYPRLCPR